MGDVSESSVGLVVAALNNLLLFGGLGDGGDDDPDEPPKPPTNPLDDLSLRQAAARAMPGNYKSNMRRLQRYVTKAGQRRQIRPRLSDLGKYRPPGSPDRVALVWRRGALMALSAFIRVSTTYRFHRMPAAGYVPITGPAMRPVLRLWLGGRFHDAAITLLRAFFVAYWGKSDPCDVGEVVDCELLPG